MAGTGFSDRDIELRKEAKNALAGLSSFPQ
jgi:hypothetical protein